MNKKQLLFIFITAFLMPLLNFGQYIKIPDVSFEKALIELGIDSDNTINGLVKRDDVILIESLDLSNRNIVDLTGIEGFMSLKKLDISQNDLERLYLENLYFLEDLNCRNNPLKILRISKFASIQSFLYDERTDEGDLAVVKF